MIEQFGTIVDHPWERCTKQGATCKRLGSYTKCGVCVARSRPCTPFRTFMHPSDVEEPISSSAWHMVEGDAPAEATNHQRFKSLEPRSMAFIWV